MIYLHIVDDFYLQGVLAKMKQKQWWKAEENKQIDTNPPVSSQPNQLNQLSQLYKNDYKVALIMHSFSWAFTITLPILVYKMVILGQLVETNYFIALSINTILHIFIDDLKANKYKINLVQDQTLHIIQIVITWLILSL